MRSALIISILLTTASYAEDDRGYDRGREIVENLSLQSNAPDAAQPTGKCEFQPLSGNASEKTIQQDSGSKKLSGSPMFAACQNMIKGSWENVVRSSKGSPEALMGNFKDPATGEYYALKNVMPKLRAIYNRQYSSANNVGNNCEAKITPFVSNVLNDVIQRIDEAQTNILHCMALASMAAQIDAIDFTDNDHISKGETSSVDGKIKCTTEGAETQDFPACKHFNYTYTTFLLGQKGVETVQQIGFATKSMDRQEDLAKSTSGKVKKSLEAQRDALDDQKGMADQNTAFHGAKGAALLAAYNRIPTPGDSAEKCKTMMNSSLAQNVKEAADKTWGKFKSEITVIGSSVDNMGGSQVSPSDVSTSDPCKEVSESGSTFMNQKAKQAMMEMMMQAGVDMLANAGKSMLLNKQVGQMDRAIKGLNEFTASVTIPKFGTASATADYCMVNPADPACGEINGRRSYDLSTGGISIGGLGSQTTVDQLTALPGTDTGSGSSPLDRNKITAPTGSLVDSVVKGSGLERTIGAASLKEGAPNAGGGGGGGGVGSVAAPNSGGGGGDGGGAGGPSGGAGLGKIAYSGGGAHSYSGGAGSGKKAQGSNNPLEGLFNKQGPKASGDILDFRGVASINDKEKDLFKLISNRYETVNKSKRLMEYEAVPKKD